MLFTVLLILAGLFTLVLGGEALLRGAVGLATLLRLTPAIIGLTVVAAGTSVPELAVSGIAAAQNKSDIAVANVVGSNIFNITAIIGLCAIIRPMPITGNTIKLEYPVLVLVTFLCLVVCQDGHINRLDATLFLAVYLAFTAYLVSLVRQQVTATEAKEFKSEVQELTPSAARPRAWVCLALIGTGIGLLAAGAHVTVLGAVELAQRLGMTERVIGLTIVSIGTGLPEVVASLVSSVRGRSDVAIGNCIGSNLFNILAILGISGLISPLAVKPALVATDGWWMLGVTLLLFPMMFTARLIARWEGALLVAVYAAYLTFVLQGTE
jgi:cation:H+ antiporter